MKYRELGATGLRISEIGFGCGNTAGLMVWGTHDEQVRVAQLAIDTGITYFDTASAYGRGKSEESLGQVLPHLSTTPLIGTKVALEDDDVADLRGAVRRSLEQSLSRLGVDHVDLVHLHNRLCVERTPDKRGAHGVMLTPDEMTGPGGMEDIFQELQREGKLRYYGFCAFGGEVPAVKSVIERGHFHSVLASYNVLNPSAGRPAPPGLERDDYGDIISAGASRGMGIVGLRVLAAGALSGSSTPHELNRGGSSERGDYAGDTRRAQALSALRLDDDESLAQVAIRFGLSNQQISTVLVGFSEMRHVEEAVACTERPVFSDADMQLVEELYRTDFGLRG